MHLGPYLPKARSSAARAGNARAFEDALECAGSLADCERIAKGLPCQTITNGDAPYLERHRLAADVYLHHFIGSDARGLFHNHPWDASASLMLWGGYVEERADISSRDVARQSYFVGEVNVIEAGDYHRLDLITDQAWTLFLAGKPSRNWGFWRSE